MWSNNHGVIGGRSRPSPLQLSWRVKGRDPWGSRFAVGSVNSTRKCGNPAATTDLAAVLDRRSSSHDQADDEQNQEDHKQDPCDLSGRACDTAQAQDPGNQRDYQKSDRPV